jgi:uncharacterized protein
MLSRFFTRKRGIAGVMPTAKGDAWQPEVLTVPLFPLQTVLFPGGKLGLKIFEQRYLDMAAACLKEQSPFGVCLLAEGQEVGQPAVPHRVGTLATIISWDMPQLGLLNVTLRGGARFRINDYAAGEDKLLTGEVELLPGDDVRLPDEFAPLVRLLRRVIQDRAENEGEGGDDDASEGERFTSAEWVGHRLCEVLPVQWLAKQKLLELDDAVSRLQILRSFLSQRGLLK